MKKITKTALLTLIVGSMIIGGTLAQYDYDSLNKIPSAVTFHHPITGAYLNFWNAWLYWFLRRGWELPATVLLLFVAGIFLAGKRSSADEKVGQR